jgi:hypothetical protein
LSQPIAQSAGSVRAPTNRGGWLTSSFRWKPGTSGTWVYDARATTFTTTAADDLQNSALNSSSAAALFNNNGGSTTADQALLFRVPSRGGSGTRRVRLYAGSRDNTLTVTAAASDGSVASAVSTTVQAGAGYNLYEILFTGPAGTELVVSAVTSAGTAAFPVIWCGAITVEDI